jgi:hypothetical protein
LKRLLKLLKSKHWKNRPIACPQYISFPSPLSSLYLFKTAKITEKKEVFGGQANGLAF